METDGSVQCPNEQPTHYVVEEEYTIGVPLVRPKSAFLKVLRLAGATGEVFTQKEICHLLKDYIGSRRLYDPLDPRVVNCGGDILGEVFGLKSFTIGDVLNLLTRNCMPMPDTCLKKKRHLVAKPLPCHQTSQQSAPSAAQPASGTQLNRVATTESSQHRVPSEDTHLPTKDQSSVQLPNLPQPSANQLSVIPPSINKSDSGTRIATKDESQSSISPDLIKSAKLKSTPVPSSTSQRKSSTSSSDSQVAGLEASGAAAAADQSEVASTASSALTDKPGESPKSRSNKRKRKKKRESKDGGPRRKRHHTEPCSSPQCTGTPETPRPTSSRRRGTSLSITYTEKADSETYPWYFEVEVEDEDENGEEVLSVQGRETASVRDSTDDLWFLEEDSIQLEVDSDTEIAVEYDLESEHSYMSESDLGSIRSGQGFLVVCQESDVEFFADYSDTDSNMGDKELSEADNWTCTECQQVNEPLFRYCSKCWKLRSDWLPSRTPSQRYLSISAKAGLGDIMSPEHYSDKVMDAKGVSEATYPVMKDLKDAFDSGFGSLSSTQETVASVDNGEVEDLKPAVRTSLKPPCVPDFDINHKSLLQETQEAETRYSLSNFQMEKSKSSSSLDSSDNQYGLNQQSSKYTSGVIQPFQTDPLLDPCIICLTKPKTASLVHGASGHQVCCFECGKRMKRRGKVCPVCRRPIQKVIKNYIL